jgi:hypothetical protein
MLYVNKGSKNDISNIVSLKVWSKAFNYEVDRLEVVNAIRSFYTLQPNCWAKIQATEGIDAIVHGFSREHKYFGTAIIKPSFRNRDPMLINGQEASPDLEYQRDFKVIFGQRKDTKNGKTLPALPKSLTSTYLSKEFIDYVLQREPKKEKQNLQRDLMQNLSIQQTPVKEMKKIQKKVKKNLGQMDLFTK